MALEAIARNQEYFEEHQRSRNPGNNNPAGSSARRELGLQRQREFQDLESQEAAALRQQRRGSPHAGAEAGPAPAAPKAPVPAEAGPASETPGVSSKAAPLQGYPATSAKCPAKAAPAPLIRLIRESSAAEAGPARDAPGPARDVARSSRDAPAEASPARDAPGPLRAEASPARDDGRSSRHVARSSKAEASPARDDAAGSSRAEAGPARTSRHVARSSSPARDDAAGSSRAEARSARERPSKRGRNKVREEERAAPARNILSGFGKITIFSVGVRNIPGRDNDRLGALDPNRLDQWLPNLPLLGAIDCKVVGHMFERHAKERHVGTHTSCIMNLMNRDRRIFEGIVDQLVGMMRADPQSSHCAFACFCTWGKHRTSPKPILLSNAVACSQTYIPNRQRNSNLMQRLALQKTAHIAQTQGALLWRSSWVGPSRRWG